jgi:hypothetical protein
MKNYLIDIDGTITDDVPNEEPDRMVTCVPKPGAVERINELFEAGNFICFFTSRTEAMRDLTLTWLYRWGFKFHDLLMNKPRGGNYVWIDNLDVQGVKYEDGFWQNMPT